MSNFVGEGSASGRCLVAPKRNCHPLDEWFLGHFMRPAWRWPPMLILVGAITANGVTVAQRYADLQASRASFDGTIGELCRRTSSCAAQAEADKLAKACQDSLVGLSDTDPRRLKLLAQTLSASLAQCPDLWIP